MNPTYLINTEHCKAHLVKIYPDLPAAEWKRVSKNQLPNGRYQRIFRNGDTKVYIETNYLDELKNVLLLGKTPAQDQPLVDAIIKIAKTVKHCGDYGFFYFNPLTKAVWISGGDGDFSGDPEVPGTDPDALEAGLKAVGVSEVQFAAECTPDEDDPKECMWIPLGRHGIEVYWDYKTEAFKETPIR